MNNSNYGSEEPALRDAMSHLPTGVSIVTSLDSNGRPCGATVNSLTSLSLDPPLILVCLSKESNTLATVLERGAFGVNVLSHDQHHLSERFASRNGVDKWMGETYHLGATGLPLIPGSIVKLECELHNTYAEGDHSIVIGFVVSAEIHFGESGPLLRFRGGYSAVHAKKVDISDETIS